MHRRRLVSRKRHILTDTTSRNFLYCCDCIRIHFSNTISLMKKSYNESKCTDVLFGNCKKKTLAGYNSRTYQSLSKPSSVSKNFQGPWIFNTEIKHFQWFLKTAMNPDSTTVWCTHQNFNKLSYILQCVTTSCKTFLFLTDLLFWKSLPLSQSGQICQRSPKESFPDEPRLAGCPLISPVPFILKLCILLQQA